MTKHLTILLFIGLAYGQNESDTSEIDYYQMGINAAVQDYKDLKPTFVLLSFYLEIFLQIRTELSDY